MPASAANRLDGLSVDPTFEEPVFYNGPLRPASC
jgi:hypothetical protein